jgi:hypothetical protein
MMLLLLIATTADARDFSAFVWMVDSNTYNCKNTTDVGTANYFVNNGCIPTMEFKLYSGRAALNMVCPNGNVLTFTKSYDSCAEYFKDSPPASKAEVIWMNPALR